MGGLHHEGSAPAPLAPVTRASLTLTLVMLCSPPHCTAGDFSSIVHPISREGRYQLLSARNTQLLVAQHSFSESHQHQVASCSATSPRPNLHTIQPSRVHNRCAACPYQRTSADGCLRRSHDVEQVYDPCTAHILARNSLALFLAQNMRDWKGLNKPAFRR